MHLQVCRTDVCGLGHTCGQSLASIQLLSILAAIFAGVVNITLCINSVAPIYSVCKQKNRKLLQPLHICLGKLEPAEET